VVEVVVTVVVVATSVSVVVEARVDEVVFRAQ